jgi:hypothetical protein
MIEMLRQENVNRRQKKKKHVKIALVIIAHRLG